MIHRYKREYKIMRIIKASNVMMILPLVGILLFVQSASAQSSYRTIAVKDGGTITGRVLLKTEVPQIPTLFVAKDVQHCGVSVKSPRLTVGKNGGVQHAVVYLRKISAGKPPDRDKEYVLNQTDCLFDPYTVVLPAETPLTIVNSDGILHNVRANRLDDNTLIVNIAQPVKGQRTTIRGALFNQSGILAVTCDAGHPWMSAYIVVVDHPYYTVTDATGGFTIDNIPPGTYELAVWHGGVHITNSHVSKNEIIRYYYEEPYEIFRSITVESNDKVSVDFELILR
jgi:hypothetical protein